MNDLAEETQNIKNRAQIFRNAALLRTLDRENRNRRYRYSRINNINNNNVRPTNIKKRAVVSPQSGVTIDSVFKVS
jgi:hypothetical protein